jgi:hypothetical protein
LFQVLRAIVAPAAKLVISRKRKNILDVFAIVDFVEGINVGCNSEKFLNFQKHPCCKSLKNGDLTRLSHAG